jgi:hypothetical protein
MNFAVKNICMAFVVHNKYKWNSHVNYIFILVIL